MVRRQHGHQLVVEQPVIGERLVAVPAGDDRDVDLSLAEGLERTADRGRHDPELDGGAGRTEITQHGGQPVVRGVALGAEPDQLAPADRPAGDRLLDGIQLAQHGRAVRSSRSPASVGVMPRRSRGKSAVPSRCSRVRRAWLSAGWVTPSRAAAAVSVPASAMAARARSWRVSSSGMSC